MSTARNQRAEPGKGLAAGLAAGLVASWSMNQFRAGRSKVSENLRPRLRESQSQHTHAQADSEGPTEEVAGVVSALLLRRELSTEQRKRSGPVVHYAFGAVMGALYGLLAEVAPRTRAGFGTAFGTAVFAGMDEAGLAVLGLARPTEYPLSTHAYALASHIVYGATTEGVRRAVRRIW